MAERGDLTFQYSLSPRVITVASPSTQLTVQDLVDTVRASEDDLLNSEDRALISARGKEELGGGVTVGITATLQDSVIAFASRKTWTSTGTVTTPDTLGVTLTDSTATFIADGVVPGAWVVNLTDGSQCTVLKVIDENTLRTDGLGGGTDDQFDSADSYRIKSIVQCEVSGGNAVAIDKTGVAISPVLPTAGTQVVRTSSSSATLQELQDIQQSSFNEEVLVDPTDTTGLSASGTAYPTGTRRRPSNNFTDGLSIANTRGLNRLHVLGGSSGSPIQLVSNDFRGFRIIGDSPAATFLEVLTGALVEGTEYADMDLRGTFDGLVFIENCVVRDATFVEGSIERSRLRGTIALSGGPLLSLLDCVDDIAGLGAPAVDFGGAGSELIVRNFRGGLTLTNKSGPEDVSVDGVVRLVLTSSYAGAGALIVRGLGPPVVVQGSFTNYTDRLVDGGQLRDLWRLGGLDTALPLVVTPTTRRVPSDGSEIDQTIDEVGSTVTVTRQ